MFPLVVIVDIGRLSWGLAIPSTAEKRPPELGDLEDIGTRVSLSMSVSVNGVERYHSLGDFEGIRARVSELRCR
jgi:hypothetical protein